MAAPYSKKNKYTYIKELGLGHIGSFYLLLFPNKPVYVIFFSKKGK